MSQLRHLNGHPDNYRQLFIQREASIDNNKLELRGAVRSYKVSPIKQAANQAKSLAKASPAKKVGAKKKHLQNKNAMGSVRLEVLA